MGSRYQAVIFDMDGTVVDSLRFHVLSFHAFLNGIGYVATEEEVRTNIGDTIDCVLRGCRIPEDAIWPVAEQIDAFYSSDMLTDCARLPAFVPGAKPLLEKLRTNGVRTALLSNSKSALVDKIVAHNGAEGLFDAAMGASADSPDKLKNYCKLAECLGVDGKRSLYVGDRKTDILFAAQCGMDCCIVRRYGWERDYARALSEVPPRYVIDDIGELARLALA